MTLYPVGMACTQYAEYASEGGAPDSSCKDSQFLSYPLQLAVYNSPAVNETPLAVSDCMFVHNNSKHGKKSDSALPGKHQSPWQQDSEVCVTLTYWAN